MVGLVLLVSGLGVGGYLLWEVKGTTWLAERRQAETLQELEQGWAAGEDRVEAGDSTAVAVLRIPRFGPAYAVPLVGGTSDESLAAGVGVFDSSADPGEKGNLALAGHRITHGEPFADLPDLRVGDTVVIETRRTIYTYVLDTDGGSLVVPFTQTWVVGAQPDNPDPYGPGPTLTSDRLLTLTTCSELFHTEDRMVVFGHLAHARPRTDEPPSP